MCGAYLVRRCTGRQTSGTGKRSHRKESILEEKDGSITRLGRDEGRSLWVLGDLLTYKVTAEQTAAEYGIEVAPPWVDQAGSGA